MLKGTLDDFTLSDIFRLLSYSKKTGRLDVSRSAGDGQVFFRDGDVYFAQSGLNTEPLGQKLIRSGVIKQRQLRKALDEQATSGDRLGRILLSSGAIRTEHLEAAVRQQIQDAAFELLRWELGEFSWEPDASFDAEIAISVAVENLIMEAARRVDELDVIARKIPSIDAVMYVVEEPPEGARELKISPDEWRVLVLVDGERTVQEVVRRSTLDNFMTLRTLYGLVSTGLIQLAGSARPETGLSEADMAPAPAGSLAKEEIPVAGPPAQRGARPPAPAADDGPAAPVPPPAEPAVDAEAVDAMVAPAADHGVVDDTSGPLVDEPEPAAVEPREAAVAQDIEHPVAGSERGADEPAAAGDTAGPPDGEEPPTGTAEVVVGTEAAEDSWFEDPEVPAATEPSAAGSGTDPAGLDDLFEEPALDATDGRGDDAETSDVPEEITLPSSGPEAEAPTVNRAAVVRELASLFSEDEESGRSRPPARGGSGRKGSKEEDEDDDAAGKGGLISRLGRKGS